MVPKNRSLRIPEFQTWRTSRIRFRNIYRGYVEVRSVPFVFEETTNDFQDVTLQGQLTYRVTDPHKLTQVLDYSIDALGRYKTDDPEKLKERLVQAIQVHAHSLSQTRSLETIMTLSSELSNELLTAMRASETTQMLGIEILALSILSVKASPEIAKAMQADTREKLLTRADESSFARISSIHIARRK